ncbi:SDR family oxidoreductase, partial [Polymorphospora rubra]|uniref:SDR family oxidoreductase n=1 Tax=Polymorphospora rubra TaxID=338584 RepID=UPI0033FB903C
HDTPPATVATLHRDHGDLHRMVTALTEAHNHAIPVDWNTFYQQTGHQPHRVDLPTYAFQRQHYWLTPTTTTTPAPTSPDDAAFWDIVERGDIPSLADVLGTDTHDALHTVAPMLAHWRRRQHDRSTIDSWRYRIEWRPADRPRGRIPSGTWIAVLPPDHVADDWTHARLKALAAAGYVVHETMVNEGMDRQILAERLGQVAEPAGVISLLALAEDPHPTYPALSVGMTTTLLLLQAMVDAGITAPLWLVTRAAISIGPDDPAPRPAQAAVWGLGRVIALEHPERWGGLIDLPETMTDRVDTLLHATLAGTDDEDQIVLSPSGAFARRLVRSPLRQVPATRTWKPGATVLLTGGLGALGPGIARWLARNGATHLVMPCRRGPAADGATDLAAELAALGCRTTVVACDITERDALAALIDQVHAEGERFTAVVHAAAVIELAALADTTLAEVAEVAAAKIVGAAHLGELLSDDPVEAFVLFSSISGIWGSGDHGAYALSNAYLDALAELWRSSGRPATSIAWGVWDSGSDEPEHVTRNAQLRRQGLPAIDAETAFGAMQGILDRNETVAVAADVDWERFLPVFSSARLRPLLGEVPEVRDLLVAYESNATQDEPSELRQLLTRMVETERRRFLLSLVRTNAATVLGHAGADEVPADRPFRELGFSSLSAVELRNLLQNATALRLPATLVFDYPNSAVLAGYLLGELLPDQAGGQTHVLEEFERLESDLALVARDESLRTVLADRLRNLLAKCGDDGGEADLSAATDEELFALVDNPLD